MSVCISTTMRPGRIRLVLRGDADAALLEMLCEGMASLAALGAIEIDCEDLGPGPSLGMRATLAELLAQQVSGGDIVLCEPRDTEVLSMS